MAGNNWQQLSGGSTNPWTIRRDDGTPTANYGDHIICDGGTVTLPSPQANEAVLVSNISSITEIVPNGTETIEGKSSVFFDQTDPIAFVSDGANWYVSNNLDYIGAIPGALFHWRFAEGSDTTVEDSIGSADMSLNGVSWTSGTWEGGYAGSGDGTDDEATAPAYEIGSARDSNGWAYEFVIQTTADGRDTIIGAAEGQFSGDNNFTIELGNESAGDLSWFEVDDGGSNYLGVYTGGGVLNDGNKKHVICNAPSQSTADWEVYINDSSVSLTEGPASSSSGTLGTTSDFTVDTYFFNEHPNSGGGGFIDAILDNIIFYSQSLSRSEITDRYNAQPWS